MVGELPNEFRSNEIFVNNPLSISTFNFTFNFYIVTGIIKLSDIFFTNILSQADWSITIAIHTQTQNNRLFIAARYDRCVKFISQNNQSFHKAVCQAQMCFNHQ